MCGTAFSRGMMMTNTMMSITKTHEELMQELLDEVRETRRYAEELHRSFTRVTHLIEEALLSENTKQDDQ